jgi:hypothetical protein
VDWINPTGARKVHKQVPRFGLVSL